MHGNTNIVNAQMKWHSKKYTIPNNILFHPPINEDVLQDAKSNHTF